MSYEMVIAVIFVVEGVALVIGIVCLLLGIKMLRRWNMVLPAW